jgi:pyruvate kinase
MGPATVTPERIHALVRAGMDVARLNFSHGSHDDHARVSVLIRQASDEVGRAVAILADLQGPKIRLGRFAVGPVHWHAGDEVRVTVTDVPGTHDRVSTTYPGLCFALLVSADVGERRMFSGL